MTPPVAPESHSRAEIAAGRARGANTISSRSPPAVSDVENVSPEPRYTPEEADRALALVRPVVEDVRRHYVHLRRDLTALRDLEVLDEITSDESVPAPVRAQLQELQACLSELRQLGVLLLDPEIGLVSLPGVLADGRHVSFCWKLGEDRVRFWFPAGSHYAERRPIVAAASS